jgi:hypothetical protein
MGVLEGVGAGDPRRDNGGIKEVIVRFHHVGMVVQSMSIADELCRERLRDDAPLVWGPVPAFQCVVAFSTRFPMIEFVVPEAESRLVTFLGGKSVLHHIAFAVDDVRRPSPFSPGELLFDDPAPAIRGLLVNFLKPHEGLLVELVQEPKKAEGRG